VVIAVKRKDMILLLLSFQPMLLYKIQSLESLFTTAMIFVAVSLHAGDTSISNCFSDGSAIISMCGPWTGVKNVFVQVEFFVALYG